MSPPKIGTAGLLRLLCVTAKYQSVSEPGLLLLRQRFRHGQRNTVARRCGNGRAITIRGATGDPDLAAPQLVIGWPLSRDVTGVLRGRRWALVGRSRAWP